ncbi:MAG: phage major capsid protein [Rhodospirillales bacterium]|nr:phage major capsid protein [Rhodospirillales bacterium]
MAGTPQDYEEMQHLTHRLREIVDLGEAQLAERAPNFQALNTRLDQLEAKMTRPALHDGPRAADSPDLETKQRQKARTKALRSLIASNFTMRNLSTEDRAHLVPDQLKDGTPNAHGLDLKALNLTDDTLGGFFVLPDIIQDEIIRNVVLISPLRGISRVMQTSSNNLKIPVLTAPTAAAWISETGTRTVSSNPQFGMKDIPTHECYALMLFSRQLLEDSFFDMEKEMSFEFAQQFAKLEGTAFVSGTGVGQPLGILNDPNMTTYTTASSGVVGADDLIGALHNWSAFAYYIANAKWVFNLNTLGVIRKLKDSQNRYLWEPGMGLADPPRLLNLEYVVAPDMPNQAASAVPIAFGDFQRGYRIVDRTQIAVQRLEELYATSAQIGVLAYKRVGAQTVLSEAIHTITCHS